jgi:hypothetical protein
MYDIRIKMNEKKKHQELLKYEKFEKRKNERHATPDEILFIFEKVLEDWKTIRIFNVLQQENKETKLTKKDVENISKGNARIYQNEITPELFAKYQDVRQKVYDYHLSKKNKS